MSAGELLQRLVAKLDAAARSNELDIPYVRRWISELGLEEQWEKATRNP